MPTYGSKPGEVAICRGRPWNNFSRSAATLVVMARSERGGDAASRMLDLDCVAALAIATPLVVVGFDISPRRRCAPSPACGEGWGGGRPTRESRVEGLPPPAWHLRCDATPP